MKIAILGVGSFVFGPSALHDAIVEHDIPELELSLYDPNTPVMEIMAGIAGQMAKSVERSPRIVTHNSLAAAIDAADFVVTSAAVQIKQRFATDCRIIRENYPDHLITEFGGVAGISYTLRQIALFADLVKQMQVACPSAWLLSTANPLPRVCEAAHRMGAKVAGFCNNSWQIYEAVGRILLGASERFPFPRTTERYWAEMAGVNHFSWLLSLTEVATGNDVTDSFVSRLKAGNGMISRTRPMAMDLLERFGKYPPNQDEHMADFLPPTGQVKSMEDSSHGTPEEREAQLRTLRQIAEGSVHYREALKHRAWEKPMDYVAAMTIGKEIRFGALNLPNAGQMPQMPADVIVETSASSADGKVKPTRTLMPEPIADICRTTAALHSLITRSAMNHDRSGIWRAVEMDPTITDKALGRVALEACMQAHEDLIGQW